MKDAKMLKMEGKMHMSNDPNILIIVKNCSVELAEKIQKLIAEHNTERKKSLKKNNSMRLPS